MAGKSFFQRVYDWIARVGKYIGDIILDMLDDAFKKFLNRMGPTIEDILKEIQGDPKVVTDAARRKAAYEKIKEAAKKEGWDVVKDSIIYRAIEIILGALKNRGEMPPNAGEDD